MLRRSLSLAVTVELIVCLALSPHAASAARPALEIVGPGGSRTFSLSALRKLPATEGLAGFKSSAGKISLPDHYRGVALKDLLGSVAGFDSAHDVRVVAKDGYSITLSYEQAMTGAFAAYDPATGDSLGSHDPLTAILAWEREGKPLDPVQDGALRIAVVSARSNQVTDGHWSVKWVTRLELTSERREWTLRLEGALTELMDRATFESGASPKCHGVTWKDAEGRQWTGVPLWLLVGRVDDAKRHDKGAFNDSLATAGYTVDVVARDGYTATFESARLERSDAILVASLLDGEPLPERFFPLRLVGPGVEKREMVGGVERIVVRVVGAQDSIQAPGR
jgi:DMSO/TMAO reductase YedYZ molybdopterin-dependent catalytic subunit